MKKLFGTDGIRGEAGKFPLDEKTIFVVGESLARQISEKKSSAAKFITGRDTRESSVWIERAFCAGANAAGAKIVSAGTITTPGVAFLARQQRADAGVVISASHNPFYDNGVKVFSPTGKKIDETTERQIERDIADSKPQTTNFADGKCETNAQLIEIYLDYLAGEFPKLDLANLKIVADCANGAASNLAPRLFTRFGASVKAICNQPNGRNINDGCGSLHMEKLRAAVVAEQADFGVAFDGDADRALFVDERGQIADGDAVLWAMANYLHNRGRLEKALVVATSMSNLGLEIALRTKNIRLVRTDVGDKYVLEELLKSKTSLGGEQSGHIIFPERSLVGDGMLTALSLLTAMRENSARLSELTEGFVRFPQILLNVRVRQKPDFRYVPAIAAAVNAVENELGERGRLVLRYSGTEPLARVMVEGENQEIIKKQAEKICQAIAAEIGEK
jgi:phosphoglucosamine mutase